MCLQGHQHHIRDGQAVDPEHSCEESVVTTVVRQFLRSQQGCSIRWNCMGCRHGYNSSTARCNKSICSSIKGHTLAQVTEMTLAMLEGMLLSVTPWDPLAEDSEAPESLSGTMLASLLLSPHNLALGGLQAVNWEVIGEEEDLGTCRCTVLRGQMEPWVPASSPPIIQEVEVKAD